MSLLIARGGSAAAAKFWHSMAAVPSMGARGMVSQTRTQLRYVSEDGEERKSDSKVVKCTCGKSNRMPYCDGSHKKPWAKLSMKQKLNGMIGGERGNVIQQSILMVVGTCLLGGAVAIKFSLVDDEPAQGS